MIHTIQKIISGIFSTNSEFDRITFLMNDELENYVSKNFLQFNHNDDICIVLEKEFGVLEENIDVYIKYQSDEKKITIVFESLDDIKIEKKSLFTKYVRFLIQDFDNGYIGFQN